MRIINELFDLSGLEQRKQFAERHKVDETLMGRYLNGKAIPKKSTLDRIADKEGYIIEETLIAKTESEKIINSKKE